MVGSYMDLDDDDDDDVVSGKMLDLLREKLRRAKRASAGEGGEEEREEGLRSLRERVRRWGFGRGRR